MTSGPDRPLKLAVLGAGGVGKTTLITRLTTGRFLQRKMTVGFDVESWVVRSEGVPVLKVSMFDLGGQPQFRFFQTDLLTGARAAMLVFDCTSFATLLSLSEWLDMVTFVPDDNKLIVGNKAEKPERVPDDVIAEICGEYGVKYVLVSALTGWNIELVEAWLCSLCRRLCENS
ncbi:MAG: Rab family GTPase [Candidatus Thorarchaeota archaeon]